ncbi:MAG: restriction endonuclease, partial [candidate division WOR-3 bacterium]
MDYQGFSSILNRHIFGEEKRDLLERIVKNPERFIGLFRPTKPESKILQNI